ncbi:Lrp/AsnC family transcriptional regulator [Bacillus sp. PK3-037]|uniref:Lrp/AsnC family transcriptional regulator n=1 Tax=Bacillus halotolerans TaxID=260554 RepID=A0A9Q4EIM4_9BACI|nr:MULTISPECIES: Lrp/AsnC family transcriptional regulator [Bacillus]AZV48724.1 Lrp/AsnC family transcriptional regulator [Bacillus halotolerans]MBL6009325.1 Lrp/AsnC family transcriptional regulator [Bacillus halotolerans]MBT9251505.1 Lrp/AsnC family transcriptional regulator [Bacillus halotolerans]MBU5247208.1 Lrp/AsnC family transcriptional regulator [Bacillus halotolerans]MBV5124246.1 Lrp/AsnC family transcriptional regulator [Bacillus halotolerans]
MDDTDLQILSHLQQNARLTMVELGKLVGLSSPSAAERVRKLEDKGVITGYSADICYEKLNKHVTAFILMEPKSCKHYAAFAAAHPDVAENHRITGMYSYVTKVVTESVHSLEDFIDASMAHGKPTTLVVLSSSAFRHAFV